MATTIVIATKIGAQRLSGKQPFAIKRGAAVGGDVSLYFDTTNITTKGQVNDAIQQILQTIGDQLK